MENNEQIQEQENHKMSDREIADKVARDYKKDGYEFTDIKDAQKKLTYEMIANDDVESVNRAVKAAGEITGKLAQLILYQEVSDSPEYLPKNLEDFLKSIYMGELAYGNTYEESFNIDTGIEMYDENQYVPNALAKPKVDDAFTISMYQSSGALTSNAYRLKKRISITENQWLPYFKQGKLSEFIARLRIQVRRVYKMYLVSKLANLIKTGTPRATVNDSTSQNMFDAMTNLGVIVADMSNLNTKYNYKSDAAINHTNQEDLLFFVNTATKSRINTGVKSQLFNADFLVGESGIATINQFIDLGKEITVPENINNPVTIGSTPYVDENTIHVISKKSLIHLNQVQREGQQEYLNNMCLEICLHVWGVVGIRNWGQWVKYTCTNLNTLPTGANSTGQLHTNILQQLDEQMEDSQKSRSKKVKKEVNNE